MTPSYIVPSLNQHGLSFSEGSVGCRGPIQKQERSPTLLSPALVGHSGPHLGRWWCRDGRGVTTWFHPSLSQGSSRMQSCLMQTRHSSCELLQVVVISSGHGSFSGLLYDSPSPDGRTNSRDLGVDHDIALREPHTPHRTQARSIGMI